ncbi:uncharacterized protein LOC110455280 [Mizuhopecten yessoensis]|uniref:Mitochondrial dynamic protein MID51 n=1 Tax=Mizuhopecten yessoensis TaxID=6573 RepID=A0A210R4I8_MIZYE|nr:uncharacterized protein LOC110455280 [Mizuhopecten yessoensis]XP_021360997.1 uncharacterized protein LOC110455280 [Mizuhopecten yessoensis]XP_021361007.1 uncharacterized protein LOC110455280 [Mizuhopecten yessoensis]OWF55824.1 Mitochondrial dynamic protein MID51 [Mizuhopecten yessoensis]
MEDPFQSKHGYLPSLYRQATQQLPSSKLRDEIDSTMHKVQEEIKAPAASTKEAFSACFKHIIPHIKNNQFGLELKDMPIYAGDISAWKPYKPGCPCYLLTMKVGKISGKELDPGYVVFPMPKITPKSIKVYNLDVRSEDKQHLCPKKMYLALFQVLETGLDKLRTIVEKEKSRSRLSRRSDATIRTDASPSRRTESKRSRKKSDASAAYKSSDDDPENHRKDIPSRTSVRTNISRQRSERSMSRMSVTTNQTATTVNDPPNGTVNGGTNGVPHGILPQLTSESIHRAEAMRTRKRSDASFITDKSRPMSDLTLLQVPFSLESRSSRRTSTTSELRRPPSEVTVILVPQQPEEKKPDPAAKPPIDKPKKQPKPVEIIEVPDISLIEEEDNRFLLMTLKNGNEIELIPTITASNGGGPLFVAKPHENDENGNSDLRWRISFAPNEEVILKAITSGDKNQRLMAAKLVSNMCQKEWKLRSITPYHIKTVLLHDIDFQVDNTPRWQRFTIDECVRNILLRLLSFIRSKQLPHFFENEFNLWGHISSQQFSIMKNALERIMRDEREIIRVLKRMRIPPIIHSENDNFQ